MQTSGYYLHFLKKEIDLRSLSREIFSTTEPLRSKNLAAMTLKINAYSSDFRD